MNRKELIREYKQRRAPMGVYRIHCTATGHMLVAACTDLHAILNRHRAQLNLGGHPSRDLQADWEQHGPDAFTFEVLDTLEHSEAEDYDPIADLTVLEDLWLERLSVLGDRIHSINPKRIAPRPK